VKFVVAVVMGQNIFGASERRFMVEVEGVRAKELVGIPDNDKAPAAG